MAATLMTPATIVGLYNDLYGMVQDTWGIAQQARQLLIKPTDPTSLTLAQSDPVARETNIQAVEDQLQLITDLNVKVEDAISELLFAIRFLEDNARRVAPLPVAIDGPAFGVNVDDAP